MINGSLILYNEDSIICGFLILLFLRGYFYFNLLRKLNRLKYCIIINFIKFVSLFFK